MQTIEQLAKEEAERRYDNRREAFKDCFTSGVSWALTQLQPLQTVWVWRKVMNENDLPALETTYKKYIVRYCLIPEEPQVWTLSEMQEHFDAEYVFEWLEQVERTEIAAPESEGLPDWIADAIAEGAEQWHSEYDSCRALLQELVDLKDLKDSEGKTSDYEERQPKAWAAAKEFLLKYQHL